MVRVVLLQEKIKLRGVMMNEDELKEMKHTDLEAKVENLQKDLDSKLSRLSEENQNFRKYTNRMEYGMMALSMGIGFALASANNDIELPIQQPEDIGSTIFYSFYRGMQTYLTYSMAKWLYSCVVK